VTKRKPARHHLSIENLGRRLWQTNFYSAILVLRTKTQTEQQQETKNETQTDNKLG